MIGLIIRRLLSAIPTLFAVSLFMFLLLFMGPNPLEQLKQNPAFTAKDVTRLSHKLGFDKPWYQQYGHWATGFVHGDMGLSITTQRPAREMIAERIPLTLTLTGMAMILSLLVAIPVGAYIAVKKYSTADYIATFMTFGMMATPVFFLGLLLQLVALKLQDLAGGSIVLNTAGPPTNWLNPIDVFQHMSLPVIALSMLQIAGWSRYQRSELLAVLESDYVKCAIAKGLPARRVFIFHAMRNTMLPIVTIVAIDLALLFSGAVVTESVFGLPGMGSLLLSSVLQHDIVVVLDIVVIGASLIVLMTTIADILYGVVDPRVRSH
jgi:peptide/nickel transport system permease protein